MAKQKSINLYDLELKSSKVETIQTPWQPQPQPLNFKLTGNEYTDYRDFLGKALAVGDTVLYTQKKYSGNLLFAFGIIEAVGGCVIHRNGIVGNTPWPCSVIVKRIKPRKTGRYKERFPCYCKELIKISQEELALMILEQGDTNFLRK